MVEPAAIVDGLDVIENEAISIWVSEVWVPHVAVIVTMPEFAPGVNVVTA